MQQTEKYQLNLIEKTDAFSPDPINENTKKLDTALAAKADTADTDAARAEFSAATAALDQRVIQLEAHHIYVGSYTGTGGELTIHLGFTPAAVLVLIANGGLTLLTAKNPRFNGMMPNTFFLRIVEGGFQVGNGGNYGSWSDQNQMYYFLALV